MSKVLIIAPHIGDELVGCWTVLKANKGNTTVAYLYDLKDNLMLDAIQAGRSFGFEIYTGTQEDLNEGFFSTFDNIYVPTRLQQCEVQRKVNRAYRQYASYFYSVDPQQGHLLEDYRNKQGAIAFSYSSLFSKLSAVQKTKEHITELDYGHLVQYHAGSTVVTFDSRDYERLEFEPDLIEWYRKTRRDSEIEKYTIDFFASNCRYPVKIQCGNQIIRL